MGQEVLGAGLCQKMRISKATSKSSHGAAVSTLELRQAKELHPKAAAKTSAFDGEFPDNLRCAVILPCVCSKDDNAF